MEFEGRIKNTDEDHDAGRAVFTIVYGDNGRQCEVSYEAKSDIEALALKTKALAKEDVRFMLARGVVTLL